MKKMFLLALVFIGCQLLSFAQDEPAVPLPESGVYILDSAKAPRSSVVYQLDDSDSYLQIYDDYAVMSYLLRGKQVFYSGKIQNVKLINVNGIEVKAFTVVTDNRYAASRAGSRIFLGISTGAIPEIYELDVVGTPGRIFVVHKASEKELQDLRARSGEY